MKLWEVKCWEFADLESYLNELSKQGYTVFKIFEAERHRKSYYTVISYTEAGDSRPKDNRPEGYWHGKIEKRGDPHD